MTLQGRGGGGGGDGGVLPQTFDMGVKDISGLATCFVVYCEDLLYFGQDDTAASFCVFCSNSVSLCC